MVGRFALLMSNQNKTVYALINLPTISKGKDSIEIPLTTELRDLIESLEGTKNQLEITIEKHSKSITKQQMKWYKGVVIPGIIEQYKEITGETLSRGDVELINKQHANNGSFITKIVDNKEVIFFKELSISQMNKDKFKNFMDNVTFYWAERSIEIPQPQADDKFNELANYISRH